MAGLARFARTLAGIGLIAGGLLPAPALAIMPEDELEANVWCYQSWFVFGVRHGYSDPVHALRAETSLVATAREYRRLAAERGLTFDQVAEIELRFFDRAEAEFAAYAADRAPPDYRFALDDCLYRGAMEMGVMQDHAERFLPVVDDALWCNTVLSILDARQRIGGGAPRVERARRAIGSSGDLVEWNRGLFEVPPEDFAVVAEVYGVRLTVQYYAWQVSGDASRFDRDYQGCFDYAEVDTSTAALTGFRGTDPGKPTRPRPWQQPELGTAAMSIWCRATATAMKAGGLYMAPAGRDYTEEEVSAAIEAATDLSEQHIADLGLPEETVAYFARRFEQGAFGELNTLAAGASDEAYRLSLETCMGFGSIYLMFDEEEAKP